MENHKEEKGRANPDLMNALVNSAIYHMKRGETDYYIWAKNIVKEVGDERIKPYLQKAWREAKHINEEHPILEESKEILELYEPITVEKIQEAYTKALSKYHPDLFDSNILKSLAVKQLSKMNNAYKSLMKRYGKENLRGSISYYQDEIKFITKFHPQELFAWGEAFGWLISGLPKRVQNIIEFPLVGYPLVCLIMLLSAASLIHKYLFNISFAILSKIQKKDFQQYHPINPTLSLILNIMAIVLYMTLLLIALLIDNDNHFFIVILPVIIMMVILETVFNLRLISGNKLKNIRSEIDLFLGL